MFKFIEDDSVRAQAQEAYDTSITEITAGVETKINEAVAGLKSKNDELLSEKKAVQEALKNFDGVDAAAAKEALKFLEENADAQLIKDGKIDELLDKRTSTLRADHNTLIEELGTKLEEAGVIGTKYKSLYEGKTIDDELRAEAIKQGVRIEALSDVLLRARGVFSVHEDGTTVEARDKDGGLMKNSEKMVVIPTNWVEGLKETHPHYWPPSAGLDADGNKTPGNLTDNQAKLNSLAAAGKMTEFRALRDKIKKAGK